MAGHGARWPVRGASASAGEDGRALTRSGVGCGAVGHRVLRLDRGQGAAWSDVGCSGQRGAAGGERGSRRGRRDALPGSDAMAEGRGVREGEERIRLEVNMRTHAIARLLNTYFI